jgi:ribulose-5-phosphate 4-epimerase/fuculose-1-phosphate aldolase
MSATMAETTLTARSSEEWRIRVELAALYRLAALHGWDDLIFTHISARVPGPEHHFLINPLGSMFEEITASSLVKINLDGQIIDSASGARVNPAGFVIHSAIHAARADAKFVVHFHSLDGIAVATQRDGLLPINQSSIAISAKLAYHDYEGIALDQDECQRLVADLGDNNMMLLRHHGTLALGSSAGVAWLNIYSLERCCSLQVRALSMARDTLLAAPALAIEKVIRQSADAKSFEDVAGLAWQALLRKLRRDSPGFDT